MPNGRPAHVSHPILLQDWKDVGFLHWRVAPERIRRRIPSTLDLDTFDGDCWIGFTPFRVEKFRVPHVPPIPWLSRFAEINVRTYVRAADGEPAVWFFSLEADRLIPALGALSAFSLPYRWARVTLESDDQRFLFRMKRPGAGVELDYEVEDEVDHPSPLESFLTARYRLFTMIDSILHAIQVEHAPWPLYHATILHLKETLSSSLGFCHSDHPPHLLYSPGVSTSIGKPHIFPVPALVTATECETAQ